MKAPFFLRINHRFFLQQTASKVALTFLAISIISILNAQNVFIKPSNKNVTYEGRIGFEHDEASIYWPGSSIALNFFGTNLSATLKDISGENYFYVIVDNKTDSCVKLQLDTNKKTYPLVKNLPFGKHSIKLFKLTNTSLATVFYGFEMDGKASILKPAPKPKRKIEFFGNSITAGHGVDVKPDSNDSGLSKYFNNYKSYAAITARHFNAQYHCTARSGIGLMLSWFPEIMPETYNRLNPYDSSSKWDFKQYTPDVVVINLFQNDYWLVNMPDQPQFKARFGTQKPDSTFIIEAYYNFLRTIRKTYPKATIICTLGSMNATEEGSAWPGYIVTAAAKMNDSKILHHFYPFKKTGGHPKVKEQEAMAESLIHFMDDNVKW